MQEKAVVNYKLTNKSPPHVLEEIVLININPHNSNEIMWLNAEWRI